MARAVSVTEAESEVLAALWRHGPLTPPRLVEAVKARRPWGDATVKTLLGRLMQKKAIRSERDDGRLLYHPLVTRDAYLTAEVRALADRLFAGDLRALAAYCSCASARGEEDVSAPSSGLTRQD